MSVVIFGILCAISLIAEFCLAGLIYEKNWWSPAAILALSMVFCGAVSGMFTYSIFFWE